MDNGNYDRFIAHLHNVAKKIVSSVLAGHTVKKLDGAAFVGVVWWQ